MKNDTKNDQQYDDAIIVNNVSKDFHLPHAKKNAIKSVFTNIFSGASENIETQHALKDISFQVRKGEFFGIVGRNGSGKSTLLKILAGIYQPTQGSVGVNGNLVPFIELGVGFNPELSGRENVYLNGALLGFTRQQIDAQYDDIVAFAELEKFMDQKLKNYSSGMQVRLAFSVATRANADILLVDEVLAVGDADFQRKCYDYFGDLKRAHKTVVFVTHDMNAVREYCDRAILIEKNHILARGTSAEVASHYTKLFLEQDEVSTKPTKGSRWGDGGISFDRVSVTPATATGRAESITIDMSVHASLDIRNPVIGFAIKDASGNAVTGTNNKLLEHTLEHLKRDDNIELSWTLPNIFGDGKFSVDVAAASPGGKIYEWYEEAAWFRVKRDNKVPYSVQPDVVLKTDSSRKAR